SRRAWAAWLDTSKTIYKLAARAHDPAMRKILRDAHHDGHDDWNDWDVDGDADAERQTKALAGLALILALALIGFYLIIQLRAVASIEDCLLAQRNNCDGPIDSSD